MKEKYKNDIMHEYTSTRVEQHKTTWRWSNFIVLGVLVCIEKYIGVHFDDVIYLLVVGAILGVDFMPLIAQLRKIFKATK